MNEKIVQTAGRAQLGDFAPMFAHLNDDVLFGEVWNEDAIDVKTKCIITVVSLMASGITDSSLTYHLQNAKAHGVSKEEIAAIITHATMYVGWPKGWAVFRQAKEVWNEKVSELSEMDKYQNTIFSQLESRMMLMLSILWDKAIWHRYLPIRFLSLMSPLSRDAAITGISTML